MGSSSASFWMPLRRTATMLPTIITLGLLSFFMGGHGSGTILVEAGPDIVACRNTPGITLSGLIEGATTTGVWSTAGDGTFNQHMVAINAVYLPGMQDVARGSVTLYLSSTNNGVSAAVKDSLLVSFQDMPQVFAGEDRMVARGTVIELAGTAVHTQVFEWSTTSDGIITEPASLSTFYVPDRDQHIEIMLNARNGCGSVTDTVTFSIDNVQVMRPVVPMSHIAATTRREGIRR